MRKIARYTIVALFILSSGLALGARAQAQSFDVDKAISTGDHKGLAEYYKSQAEAQRNIAAMHDKMKVAYRESHVHYKGSENVMAGHCGDLKFEALKAAEQFDALAKQEEKLAK